MRDTLAVGQALVSVGGTHLWQSRWVAGLSAPSRLGNAPGSGSKRMARLEGLPFRWGDGPATVGAYRASLVGSFPSRQASGSVRLAGEVIAYEFHDDGDSGFRTADGRALHNVRKSQRRVLGWFYLSGGRATFVGALVAGETYVSGLAAMFGGDATRWTLANGGWSASSEARVDDTGMAVRALTRSGLIASDGLTTVYADGSQVVALAPPAQVASNANMARAYAVPGLNAVVVPIDTQFGNFGQAYVTFDDGATWKGPVKTMTASDFFPTPQQNSVANPRLVPLYPSVS